MKNRSGDTATRGHGDKTPSPRLSASPRPRVPLITLLTDFGTADYFVGSVKGVILTVNPIARIVDITHETPAHDVEAAAFTLLAACSSFPAGTIHVAVVDPGVGSARRSLLIRTRQQYFVGPDNGIFSYICEGAHPAPEVFHLNNARYFRQPVSQTFHGRDVFAPVAAALSTGIGPDELGTRITDYTRLPSIAPQVSRSGEIKARIIHIDRFGNCVTNITPAELPAEIIAGGVNLRVNGKTVKAFRDFFSEEAGSRAQLFGIWGSAGFLEIAVANKSAAKLLKAKRGDEVTVARA
ncbi:MAG: SAM-dependent chlorinase/fluorinase [Pyrinomonadaceae bacterium]|nr:SAM-dependent chlorinase/fluorinase [Pyrinomonadaceae bacterium]